MTMACARGGVRSILFRVPRIACNDGRLAWFTAMLQNPLPLGRSPTSRRRTTLQHHQQIGAPAAAVLPRLQLSRAAREPGSGWKSVGVHVTRGRIARSAAPGFFSPAYLAYVPLIFGPFPFPFPFRLHRSTTTTTTALTSPSPRIRCRVPAAILNSPLSLCSLSRHPYLRSLAFLHIPLSLFLASTSQRAYTHLYLHMYYT